MSDNDQINLTEAHQWASRSIDILTWLVAAVTEELDDQVERHESGRVSPNPARLRWIHNKLQGVYLDITHP